MVLFGRFLLGIEFNCVSRITVQILAKQTEKYKLIVIAFA